MSGELDFLEHFYNREHTRRTLLEDIDIHLGIGRISHVRAFPCFISLGMYEFLRARGEHAIRLLNMADGIGLFEHKYRIATEPESELAERFFLLRRDEYTDVYTVLTLGDSYYFNRKLLPYFRKQYPDTSLTFITHRRLRKLLFNFKEENRIDNVVVTRTSMRSRVEGKTIPSVNWPSMTLEEVFDWAYEENAWFQRITFKAIVPQTSREIEVSISRQGVLRTDYSFSSIYKAFLSPIEKTVFDNVKIFSKRARLDNVERKVNPLYLDFGTDVFANKEDNHRFIESLKKMKASDTSVIHANPYINLSIIDYYDGSVYDIWVLNPRIITIIGQMKSSHQALKRLVNHIFDTFAEGRIREQVEE